MGVGVRIRRRGVEMDKGVREYEIRRRSVYYLIS